MGRESNWAFGVLAAVAALTQVVGARAEDEVPAGLASREAATSGATDVGPAGFQAAAAPPAEDKDARELGLSLGGLASAGNSRALAVTSAVKLRMREANDQLALVAAGNFARSAAEADAPMETTVENYQARTRYDRFLGSGLALFGALTARRDRFQGLDLRFNVDPGLAYYFIDSAATQLRSELGYDFQYDVRAQATLDAAEAEGTELDATDVRHSVRAFLGYEANLSGTVKVGTGLEYLQSVTDSQYYRLNWDGGVSSSLGGRFSIATTVTVQYDNAPLPEVEPTDVTTAVSLTYQLL